MILLAAPLQQGDQNSCASFVCTLRQTILKLFAIWYVLMVVEEVVAHIPHVALDCCLQWPLVFGQ
jgi:hypothetical protein